MFIKRKKEREREPQEKRRYDLVTEGKEQVRR